MSMQIDEQFDVALGLLEGYYGGTSASEKAFGYLLVLADNTTAEKIKTAFPNIWSRFYTIGKTLHEEYKGVIPHYDLMRR